MTLYWLQPMSWSRGAKLGGRTAEELQFMIGLFECGGGLHE
jgi:hypothetical protein